MYPRGRVGVPVYLVPSEEHILPSNKQTCRVVGWASAQRPQTLATNFMFVKKQPAKKHENILVFYKKQPTYNPQVEEGKPYKDKRTTRYKEKSKIEREIIMDLMGQHIKKPIENKGTRYPGTVQKFSNGNNGNIHPTQKPVALFEYLIKTYTNEGDLVLDNCMGSGTTAIACINTNRNYIGFEIDEEYYKLAINRIEEHKANLFNT